MQDSASHWSKLLNGEIFRGPFLFPTAARHETAHKEGMLKIEKILYRIIAERRGSGRDPGDLLRCCSRAG